MNHSKNWVMNYTHSFKTKSHAFCQQLFCWRSFVLCFLQFLYPIINLRFNINEFFCSMNYKLREVKQYRYLQIPQLIFDMPIYTHNPYLTQTQSILPMGLLCMLAHVWRHSRVVVVKQLNIYKKWNLKLL